MPSALSERIYGNVIERGVTMHADFKNILKRI